MTKSELISLLAAKQPQLDYRDVELAVKELLEQMFLVTLALLAVTLTASALTSLHWAAIVIALVAAAWGVETVEKLQNPGSFR